MKQSFADSRTGSRFFGAYDWVLARWPVPAEAIDLVSEFGTTHVQASGPPDGPPLLLLHAGGATSTVWFDNVADLSRDHRVFAVDTIGDAGRSRHDGRPIKDREDLMAWLDTVLDGLGLLGAAVVGHSYGGWLALSYALHAPQRVRALVLLEPTQCFGGMNSGYLMRAAPLFVRPSGRRVRALLRWESTDVGLDPDWLELVALGTGAFPRSKLVIGPRPEPDRLAACTVPTLVLLAEQSRVHDVAVVAKGVRELMPRALIVRLPDISHHNTPMRHARALNTEILAFFGWPRSTAI